MPIGPFRKKKKIKDLPKPPSVSDERESVLQEELKITGPPRGIKVRTPPKTRKFDAPPRIKDQTDLSKSKEYAGPPQETEFQGPPRSLELTGPPRTTEFVRPPREPELHGPAKTTELTEPPRGPPTKTPIKSMTLHPNLPPPPVFSVGTTSPPFSESEKPPEIITPLFGDETVTDEILDELKQKSFKSGLAKTPAQKITHKSADELAKRHFQDNKQSYIEAGKKHLELNFRDNAAINFACAVLCDLIIDGVESARHTMTNLSTGIPSEVRDNIIFENVRLLIEATRTKSFPFLTRAEKTLKSSMENLYPEDAAIIERGLKAAKQIFGLE